MVSSCIRVGAELVSFENERKELKKGKMDGEIRTLRKEKGKEKYVTLFFPVLINKSLDLGQKLF